MPSSTALTLTQQRVKTVRDLLMRSQAQIATALPKHLTAERMMRVAMTTIQKSPSLLAADPKSLIAAIVQASELGLEPNYLTDEVLAEMMETVLRHKADIMEHKIYRKVRWS